MQSMCRYELCQIAAAIIGKELEADDFLNNSIAERNYEKARYLYVYYCRVHLNCSFRLIRHTLYPIWNYKKTVYKVFERQYERRREQEYAFLIQYFKEEFERKMKDYKDKGIEIKCEGKQLKMFHESKAI